MVGDQLVVFGAAGARVADYLRRGHLDDRVS
jgi:hypothetical protein